MEDVVAGLDVGTSSIKIVLYGKKGVIYSDRMNHSKGNSDGIEIDPLQLINDIVAIIRKAVNENMRIKAIGLSCLFPSFVALDENGTPLTKIITWIDTRGNEEVIKFKENKEKVKELQEKTGCVVHESHNLWKIMWLKENKKELFLKTSKFLSLQEYIIYKLTGKFAISYALASTTGLFNINSLKWDDDILKLLGISKHQLSKCYEITHTEQILKAFVSKTGLIKEPLLVIGAGDGQLSNIGSGCLTEKTICSTIGTSAALRVISTSAKKNQAIWTYYLYEKKYIKGIATNSGFSTLIWLYNNLFYKDSKKILNEINKIDTSKSTDIIFLPFLDGERGPGYNQRQSASLFGLNSKNTHKDILKAAIEGILFNMYDCYQRLIEDEEPSKEIVATGGYLHSGKMLQMQADIFNIRIKVPLVKEASALGAAIICLIAIGKIKTISDIKTEYEKVYVPDPKKREEYIRKYEKYQKHYYNLLEIEKQNICPK